MSSRLLESRLEALIEAGISLSSEHELDTLLQRTAQLAREIIGARFAAVAVLGEDETLSRFIHSGMDGEEVSAIGHLPDGTGVLGAVIESNEPLRLAELRDHPRSIGFPDNHPVMHSFLGVPIVVRGRVFGRLYLTEKIGAREFSEDDERMAFMFASQAGVALENARLYEENELLGERLRDLAVLEERDRISKELHDGVIQSIYSVGLSLQGSLALSEREPRLARKRIDQAIAELDNVVRDVRGYIFDLQPKSVQHEGVGGALRELVEDLHVNTLAHTLVDFDDDAFDVLDETERVHLVQIVREILSNIARHAEATEVIVRCDAGPDGFTLTIDDDGVGFDPETVIKGYGLRNMAERARRIGSRVEIGARTPRGTRHRIRWSRPPEAPE